MMQKHAADFDFKKSFLGVRAPRPRRTLEDVESAEATGKDPLELGNIGKLLHLLYYFYLFYQASPRRPGARNDFIDLLLQFLSAEAMTHRGGFVTPLPPPPPQAEEEPAMKSLEQMMKAMMMSMAKKGDMQRMATHIHENIDGVQSTVCALTTRSRPWTQQSRTWSAAPTPWTNGRRTSKTR